MIAIFGDAAIHRSFPKFGLRCSWDGVTIGELIHPFPHPLHDCIRRIMSRAYVTAAVFCLDEPDLRAETIPSSSCRAISG